MTWFQKQEFRIQASHGGFEAWNRFQHGKLSIENQYPREWLEVCSEPDGPEEAW